MIEDGDLDRILELNQIGDRLNQMAAAHLHRARGLRGFRLKWRYIGRAEGLTEAFQELHRLEQHWLTEAREKRE